MNEREKMFKTATAIGRVGSIVDATTSPSALDNFMELLKTTVNSDILNGKYELSIILAHDGQNYGMLQPSQLSHSQTERPISMGTNYIFDITSMMMKAKPNTFVKLKSDLNQWINLTGTNTITLVLCDAVNKLYQDASYTVGPRTSVLAYSYAVETSLLDYKFDLVPSEIVIKIIDGGVLRDGDGKPKSNPIEMYVGLKPGISDVRVNNDYHLNADQLERFARFSDRISKFSKAKNHIYLGFNSMPKKGVYGTHALSMCVTCSNKLIGMIYEFIADCRIDEFIEFMNIRKHQVSWKYVVMNYIYDKNGIVEYDFCFKKYQDKPMVPFRFKSHLVQEIDSVIDMYANASKDEKEFEENMTNSPFLTMLLDNIYRDKDLIVVD